MSINMFFYQSLTSRKLQIRSSLYILLLLICFTIASQPAAAAYSGHEVRSKYTFLPEQSTLHHYDSPSTFSDYYSIEGQFELYGDRYFSNSVYFVDTNAVVIDSVSHTFIDYLEPIFALYSISGSFINNSKIRIEGTTEDGTYSDILLILTFENDLLKIEGTITPPSSNGEFYELNAVAKTKYGGGIGTYQYPYIINTAQQMNEIGRNLDDWESYFLLTNDISLSDYKNKFNIIGYYKSESDNKPFSGVFNGNNKAITDFTYTISGKDRVGLFGYIKGKTAEIKNLGIIDPNISSNNGKYIGSLAGHLIDGSITNCYVIGGNISGSDMIGGLIGWNNTVLSYEDLEEQFCETGKISYCICDANVNGNNKVGGLIGLNDGVITDCNSTVFADVNGMTETGSLIGLNNGIVIDCNVVADANITGTSKVGGMVGFNKGVIMHCAISGDPNVIGTKEIGGLVGFNKGIISDCNTTGQADVTGQTQIGGFAGINDGIISDCNTFADVNVIGETEIGGYVGLNKGLISDCNSIAKVIGDNLIGGMVGYNCSIIRDCNSISIVSGNLSVGALVGNNTGQISGNHSEGSVIALENVGGISGINNGGYIKNCFSNNTINGQLYVGGIAGTNSGNIINSSSAGQITGDSYVGGCAGKNYFYILNSLSNANIVTHFDFGGGLAGANESNGIIENSYSTGTVSGMIDIGGLLGFNNGVTMKCYSTGTVIDNYSADGVSVGFGGLIGSCTQEAYSFLSYWNTQTSGWSTSAGGKGKTTAQLKNKTTFNDWGKSSIDINNDDVIYWTINQTGNKDYPRLSWENIAGDAIETVFITDLLAGSGTENDPFLIDTPEKLNSIGLFPNEWDKCFKLSADINLQNYTGDEYNVIGWYRIPFKGTFEGNNHKITNLTYSSIEENYVGLFGFVKSLHAKVSNVGLMNPVIDAKENIGSLVGYISEGTITGCYAENAIVNGDTSVAGLVGYNQVAIDDCHVTGKVTGYVDVGGLVGNNAKGTIDNCYSDTMVSGDSYVGGLVGSNTGAIQKSSSINNIDGYQCVGGLVGKNESSIEKSYSTGIVSGTIQAGGLAGWNFSSSSLTNCYSRCSVLTGLWGGGLVGINEGSISKCYSSGNVIGTRLTVGGLAALDFGTVSSSFWDIETSGQSTSAAGTGKTTENMKKKTTYSSAGWDFSTIWKITENQDYPKLIWEAN